VRDAALPALLLTGAAGKPPGRPFAVRNNLHVKDEGNLSSLRPLLKPLSKPSVRALALTRLYSPSLT
jgi:hypothetical protein